MGAFRRHSKWVWKSRRIAPVKPGHPPYDDPVYEVVLFAVQIAHAQGTRVIVVVVESDSPRLVSVINGES